jgi:hypothetical protein
MTDRAHESALLYWYRAYHLLIASSIPIPEMIEVGVPGHDADAAPDVVVSTGCFSDHLTDPLESSPVHQANARALLLRVEGVARYLVRDGREILIDVDPSATPHDVRVFLLGTCLGALLHQRGHLVLHASGVALEESCMLFTGTSGAGKSTLLAEFLRRGHQMVVDDVCAVRFDAAGQPIVVPSYPRTRLWADAAERFNVDTSGLPRTRPTWDKFERQVDQFSDREAKLTHVFHLAGSHDAPDALERLPPMQAFTTLLQNTYRAMLLDGLGRRADHFELVSRAASTVAVVSVTRSSRSGTVEEVADLILRFLDGS